MQPSKLLFMNHFAWPSVQPPPSLALVRFKYMNSCGSLGPAITVGMLTVFDVWVGVKVTEPVVAA